GCRLAGRRGTGCCRGNAGGPGRRLLILHPGFARATPGLRLRNRSLLGLVQIQSDLLGLARLLGNVDVGSRTELLAEGWLCPVGAGNEAGRTEQLIVIRSIREVSQIALQLQAYARASTHAPPAVEKDPRDNQKADDDQPFTQTKIHE